MTDPELPRRIEYMDLGDLVARRDPRNVKAHADDALDASIDRFGFAEPVMLDERTGKLVAGHGRVNRLAAAANDAYTDPERPPSGLIATGDGTWLVPVIRGWSSLDDDEAQAFMIAVNRIGEVGGWTDALAPLLAELAATDAGLPPGYDQGDLDRLLAELEQPDFQPGDGDDQPRLDRKFHLVCNNCGAAIDPAAADRIEQ